MRSQRADHMGFLKAGQAAQFSGYAASIFLDNAQDWELVADLKGHGKYPDVIQRSRQRPDKVIHSVPTHQFTLVELIVPDEPTMEGQHMFRVAKYDRLSPANPNGSMTNTSDFLTTWIFWVTKSNLTQ